MEKKPRPNVSLSRFSRAIMRDPKNTHLANRWANKGWLDFIPGNPRTIERHYAVQILSLWRHSLVPADFARAIGANEKWVRKNMGEVLVIVEVAHFVRILKSEISRARELWLKSQEGIIFPDKKGLARYSPERLAEVVRLGRQAIEEGKGRGPITEKERKASSERLKMLHQLGKIPYPDSSRARELGAKGGKIVHQKGLAYILTDDDRRTAVRKRWAGRDAITTEQAAEILHLPVWRTLALLRQNLKKNEQRGVDGHAVFKKQAVENFALEHMERLSRLRTTGKAW